LKSLKKAGCQKIFREKVSGFNRQRPEFQRMLDQIRPGDIIVVWKLDRLARSTRDLLNTMDTINEAGDLIRERTGAGREAAKQRGVRFGRPRKLNPDQAQAASQLLSDGKAVREIAKAFNVHEPTIYRLAAASI
jgi:DNA invertase Pin-like site-specific DNA recombinase